jgi:mono/diheme cytochrome c family protein
MDWDASISRQVNRDIIEGRVIPRRHRDSVCIEDVQLQMDALFQHADGELLLETLRFANKHSMPLPKGYAEKLVLDTTLPIEIRTYALQKDPTEELLDIALQSDRWQLRSTARDVLLRQQHATAVQELLHVVKVGEVFEAQAAIQSLSSERKYEAELVGVEIRKELKLEYAEMSNEKVEDDWLTHGGNPSLGEKIVFENSRSECLRCHKIHDRGGIAGPSLDGVGTRLGVGELLGALLSPNNEVADGFGDYSAMPPMGTLLTKREIRDVVAYLKTLAVRD